MDNLSLEERAI